MTLPSMSVPLSNRLHVTGDMIYSHFCSGCNRSHYLATANPDGHGERWVFNGNINSPTFTPGHKVRAHDYDDQAPPGQIECSYFLTDGMIQFQSDCRHKLAGMTVELPEYR